MLTFTKQSKPTEKKSSTPDRVELGAPMVGLMAASMTIFDYEDQRIRAAKEAKEVSRPIPVF
jgi:hypothetical protein